MSSRSTRRLVREGDFAAEVEVQVLETEGGWAPYLSLDDAVEDVNPPTASAPPSSASPARGDTTSLDDLVRRFADRFWKTDWPGNAVRGQ